MLRMFANKMLGSKNRCDGKLTGLEKLLLFTSGQLTTDGPATEVELDSQDGMSSETAVVSNPSVIRLAGGLR